MRFDALHCFHIYLGQLEIESQSHMNVIREEEKIIVLN